MPLIISKEGEEAVRLEQSSFTNEIDLQKYIEAHPEAIPLDDIKENVEFLILDREFPVSVGSIDALGVDSDGDIYIIETKLYKNSDKRRVVAQVLDYGAALWTKNENPQDWIDTLEKRLKDKEIDFEPYLEENFGQSEDTIQGMIENLSAGAFRFIILMDQVPSALKDLILYINQNSSFSVYGVELEYYAHEDMKILKPQVFGSEVKRKSVSSTSSKRRRWDEISFFEELETRIDNDELVAVRKFYDFTVEIGDELVWGSGAILGSFNPKIYAISTNTLYRVFTDGSLQFHHNWMDGNEVSRNWRDKNINLLNSLDPIRQVYNQKNTKEAVISLDIWVPLVDEIIEVIRNSIEEFR